MTSTSGLTWSQTNAIITTNYSSRNVVFANDIQIYTNPRNFKQQLSKTKRRLTNLVEDIKTQLAQPNVNNRNSPPRD